MGTIYRISEEKEDALFTRFPTLFPDGRNVDKMRSLMCFGIDCCVGWYDLIWKLCEDIERVELEMKVPSERRCQVVQLKSKYAGLRFYTNGHIVKVDELISAAEEKSYTTCEYCGALGIVRRDLSWITTLCDEHHTEVIIDRFGSIDNYKLFLSEKHKQRE